MSPPQFTFLLCPHRHWLSSLFPSSISYFLTTFSSNFPTTMFCLHVVACISLFIHGSGSICISVSISSLPPLFLYQMQLFHPVSTSANIELQFWCCCFSPPPIPLFFLFQEKHRCFLFELCVKWNGAALSQHESIICPLSAFLYSTSYIDSTSRLRALTSV